jgi:hypothetical protein
MVEKINRCETNEETIKDHERRIQTLEKQDAILSTKLDTTNKILVVIATMIGGGIVSVLFGLLTHSISFGG